MQRAEHSLSAQQGYIKNEIKDCLEMVTPLPC